MTLQELQEIYPPKSELALTGYIPIEWANSNDKEIKQICKENKLRIIFRGPRQSRMNFTGRQQSVSSTLKKDAYAFVLYRRSEPFIRNL